MSSKNVISVDPIKGLAFYHKYDFIGRGFSGASINLLYNENLNKYNGLFICKAIEKTSKEKADYSNLFNSNRLSSAKILLPVTSDGEPDYEFMELYIKEKELIKLKEYINFMEDKLYKN